MFKKLRYGLVTLPSIEEVAAKFQGGGAPAAPAAAPAVDPGAAPVTAEPAVDAAPAAAATAEPAVDPATPAEAAPAEAPKEEKRDPSAARFAALARRDREIRQRESEVQNRLKDAETRAAALAEKEALLAKKPASPIELLKQHGYSLEDANLAAFGQTKEKEKDPLDLKLEERITPIQSQLEKANETIEKLTQTLEALQSERTEIAKREVRRDIMSTVDRENLEMIKAVGEEAVVMVENVIANYFKQHQRVLSYSEACGIVEQYYFDAVSKLAETPKVKSRFAPPTTPSPAPSKPKTTTTEKAKERPTTLTQAHSAAPRATSNVDSMSRNDAIEYLAKKLQYINR
jgi:hypothetical protein